jgi:hypothetical protein
MRRRHSSKALNNNAKCEYLHDLCEGSFTLQIGHGHSCVSNICITACEALERTAAHVIFNYDHIEMELLA